MHPDLHRPREGGHLCEVSTDRTPRPQRNSNSRLISLIFVCALIVRFSPDGRWVASSAKDGQVLFWDLVAGVCGYPVRSMELPVTFPFILNYLREINAHRKDGTSICHLI